MAGPRLQALGDDLEETLGSLMSAPGAFGNIVLGVARQVRLFDGLMLGLMVGGWGWLAAGYLLSGNDDTLLLVLALLPTLVWVVCGIIGGLVFEVGGVGWRSLAFWESYLLMVLFIAFGVISLRLAMSPRDRRVYRGSSPSQGT